MICGPSVASTALPLAIIYHLDDLRKQVAVKAVYTEHMYQIGLVSWLQWFAKPLAGRGKIGAEKITVLGGPKYDIGI